MHVYAQLYKQHFSEQLDDDEGDGDEGGSQPPKKRSVSIFLPPCGIGICEFQSACMQDLKSGLQMHTAMQT